MRKTVLLFATACVAMAATATAGAIACGTQVLQSMKLTADIGPCNPALVIEGAPGDITVDLNGHSINGSIFIETGAYGATTIKGPGTIRNGGIETNSFVSNVIVYDITFEDSDFFLAQGSSARFFNNIIKSSKGVPPPETSTLPGGGAIRVGESLCYIYGNVISGQDTAIYLDRGQAIVGQNIITGNNRGIYITGDVEEGFIIHGNQISLNRSDGILLSAGSGGPTIEDNTIFGNGGSGIVGQPANGTLIRDNFINSNRVYGVGLSVTAGAPSRNTTVEGNRLANNGTDLFLNSGISACFSQNIFKSSSPLTLPSCP